MAGELVLVGAVALVLATLGGLTGFGVGLVLPPFLAPIVGIQGVVPVLAVAFLIMNASRVVAFRRDFDLRAALVVLASSVPAAALGALVYTWLPERGVALVLGGFLLLILPLRRWLGARRFKISRAGLALVGAGYGFLTGTVTGAGIVLIAGMLAAGVAAPAIVATDAAVAVALNLAKIGVFAGTGVLDPAHALAGVLVGGCTVPGAFLARRLVDRLPMRLHAGLMEAMVVAGAGWFLWRALC